MESLLDEEPKAKNFRISLLMELARYDFPMFLVVEIEYFLCGLQYQKLYNLIECRDLLKEFWTKVQKLYTKDIADSMGISSEITLGEYSIEFGTRWIYKKRLEIHRLSAFEASRIKCRFSLMCLLQLKEWVYGKELARPLVGRKLLFPSVK